MNMPQFMEHIEWQEAGQSSSPVPDWPGRHHLRGLKYAQISCGFF
jgi:hypothetical protein